MEIVEQKKPGLNTLEIMSSVYDSILQKLPHKELDFGKNPPKSVVADDSDSHRLSKGTIFYDKVSIVTAGDKQWVLALGTRAKGYPADDFSFDFKAFQYNPHGKNKDEQKDEIYNIIWSSPLFQRSLVIGIAGRGMIINEQYQPSIRLGDQLRPKFKNLVAQMPEIDDSHNNDPGFGPPILKTAIRYKPELSGAMVNTILELLQD